MNNRSWTARLWSVRHWLALGVLAACLAVMAWLWMRPTPLPIAKPGQAQPALWQVEKGDRRAFLFGTMHVLPNRAKWITPQLRAAIEQSDRLILEAWNLDDQDASRAIFARLGTAAKPIPLARRLSPEVAAQLPEALDKADIAAGALDRYESWAAAIILSANLLPEDGEGVEPALTKLFKRGGKPVQGLETVEQQFSYLDKLPMADQDHFLSETVAQSDNDTQVFQTFYTAWLKGDLNVLRDAFAKDIASAPALRQALLIDRNRAWAIQLDSRLAKGGVPMIAVGTAHLVGADNLIDMLRARGYRVTRIQ